MPRTATTLNTLTTDSSIAQPAGNAADPTNGHVVADAFDKKGEILVDIDSTFAGAKVWTIKGTGGQSDLAISINAARRVVGPLSSSRFEQADGELWIDVEAAATGTIRAYRVRTV